MGVGIKLSAESEEFIPPQYSESYGDPNMYQEPLGSGYAPSKWSYPQYHPYNPHGSQQGHPMHPPRQSIQHNNYVITKKQSDYFLSEAQRRKFEYRSNFSILGTNPDDPLVQGIPKKVGRYFNLYPLENISKNNSNSVLFGLPTMCYKATDGRGFYCLRKMNPSLFPSEHANQAIKTWKSMEHPNVVSLVEIFPSKDFLGANSLIFAYEYHFGYYTLDERFLSGSRRRFNEDTLWMIIIQVISALRIIHANNLAARTIHSSKVLINNQDRIRINCVGINDYFYFDNRATEIKKRQMEDIIHLGELILKFACLSHEKDTLSKMKDVQATYSGELHNILCRLLALPRQNIQPSFPSLEELQLLISTKMFTLTDRLWSNYDSLENELYKEYENGRLLRLLVKLGLINERPEFDKSSNWSETGDRYLIKLFRDYVFHQVDEQGNPVIDYGYVIDCLNKLDLASDEKILLMTRDERSMLLLKYEDIHRCIHEAYKELVQASNYSSMRSMNNNPQMQMPMMNTPQQQYGSHPGSGNYYM